MAPPCGPQMPPPPPVVVPPGVQANPR
jgi:hypothetical protein